MHFSSSIRIALSLMGVHLNVLGLAWVRFKNNKVFQICQRTSQLTYTHCPFGTSEIVRVRPGNSTQRIGNNIPIRFTHQTEGTHLHPIGKHKSLTFITVTQHFLTFCCDFFAHTTRNPAYGIFHRHPLPMTSTSLFGHQESPSKTSEMVHRVQKGAKDWKSVRCVQEVSGEKSHHTQNPFCRFVYEYGTTISVSSLGIVCGTRRRVDLWKLPLTQLFYYYYNNFSSVVT